MRELGVAIVGFGKIARDQYVPAALTPRRTRLAAPSLGEAASFQEAFDSYAMSRLDIGDSHGTGVDTASVSVHVVGKDSDDAPPKSRAHLRILAIIQYLWAR